MKAGVLHAREDIRYEEVETPVPKAGEVLVKVKYSGICGWIYQCQRRRVA